MQPGQPLLHGQGPLASRRAQRPVRTIITSPDADFHARLLLPAFQVFGIDRRARLQPVHALVARHVHQHAAGDDAVLEIEDAVLGGAILAHFVRGIAVVHLAVIEEVAQRIHVGVRHSRDRR